MGALYRQRALSSQAGCTLCTLRLCQGVGQAQHRRRNLVPLLLGRCGSVPCPCSLAIYKAGKDRPWCMAGGAASQLTKTRCMQQSTDMLEICPK